MKLFTIKPFVRGNSVNCFDQHIIIAESFSEARQLAAKHAAAEGEEVWLSASQSSCIELVATGRARIIISDFRAG